MNIFSVRSSILLALAVPTVFAFAQGPAGKDTFHLMNSESIGGIKIDMEERAVLSLIKGNPAKGPSAISEVDGLLHQMWFFRKLGIKLNMAKEDAKDPKRVNSIEIVAPCRLSTSRGIHIGSSESETIMAYKGDYDPESSEKGRMVIAGSIYGGLAFEIKNGKVIRIFIGAGAE